MFIRFRADTFDIGKKTMVKVYDHKTGHTIVMTMRQYNRISDYLADHGGIIFGAEEDSNE